MFQYNTFATSILRYHLRPDGDNNRRQGPIERSSNPFLNVSQSYQNYNATSSSQTARDEIAIRGGLSRTEGPCRPEKGVLLGSQEGQPTLQPPRLGIRGMSDTATSLGASVFGSGPDVALHTEPMELTTTDMALSTLYLHEIHHRQVRNKNTKKKREMTLACTSRTGF